MIDLEAIKARCEAATPGPCILVTQEYRDGGHDLLDKWIEFKGQAQLFKAASNYPQCTDEGRQDIADAEFFACARADIPALLTEVERLRDMVDERNAELAILRRALDTIPLHEYGEAQREGCDAKGAWGCFREALTKHIESVRSCPVAYAAKEYLRALEIALEREKTRNRETKNNT